MEQTRLEHYIPYITFEDDTFVVYEFRDKLYFSFMHFIANLLKNAPEFIFKVVVTKEHPDIIKVLLRKDTLEWFE